MSKKINQQKLKKVLILDIVLYIMAHFFDKPKTAFLDLIIYILLFIMGIYSIYLCFSTQKK